ncbi:MAG: LuxR C-terminal-related transcriptional regulator [Pseudomonadota bacterium]
MKFFLKGNTRLCAISQKAGLSSEIADLLLLSSNAVSTYRTRILRKMSMKNNAELTRYAISLGLIE